MRNETIMRKHSWVAAPFGPDGKRVAHRVCEWCETEMVLMPAGQWGTAYDPAYRPRGAPVCTWTEPPCILHFFAMRVAPGEITEMQYATVFPVKLAGLDWPSAAHRDALADKFEVAEADAEQTVDGILFKLRVKNISNEVIFFAVDGLEEEDIVRCGTRAKRKHPIAGDPKYVAALIAAARAAGDLTWQTPHYNT